MSALKSTERTKADTLEEKTTAKKKSFYNGPCKKSWTVLNWEYSPEAG